MSFARSHSNSKSRSVSPQQLNQKIQDSLDNLDNLSNTKLRQSALEKNRLQLISVKQKFVTLLERLQHSQTREVSLGEIKKLIEKNCESDHLRLYLSILKALKSTGNSSTTKEHEVLVLSIITCVFKQNLIDPIDKQPSLPKTCFKVVQILLGFFNDSSNSVQQACARVLLDLDSHCMSSSDGNGLSVDQKLSILWTPLISIIKNGVDKASQATSTVCINQMIKYWASQKITEYLDKVCSDVFQIIMKLNSEYQDIFMAMLIVLDHKGLNIFENKLPNFLAKILGVINGTRQAPNSLNAYMVLLFTIFQCRVNVCKIIQMIAGLLTAEQREKLVDLNVIGSLQKTARNKIIQVQTAATRALKAWKGEPINAATRTGSTGNAFYQHQQSGIKSNLPRRLTQLDQARKQRQKVRSSSQDKSIKIEAELNYMKQDLEKMVKGGWGANHRAKNYVKRGTGVGGGHYGQVEYSSTPPKNGKSHRQHLQELREMIKKGSKENKNTDKFGKVPIPSQQFYVPTNSNNDVPTNSVKNKNSNSNLNSGSANKVNNKGLDVGIDPSYQKVLNRSNNNANANADDDDQFAIQHSQGLQNIPMKNRGSVQKPFSSNSQQVYKPHQTNKHRRKEQSQADSPNQGNSRFQYNSEISPSQAKELLQHQDEYINFDECQIDLGDLQYNRKNTVSSEKDPNITLKPPNTPVDKLSKGPTASSSFKKSKNINSNNQQQASMMNANNKQQSNNQPQKIMKSETNTFRPSNFGLNRQMSRTAERVLAEQFDEQKNISEVSENFQGLLSQNELMNMQQRVFAGQFDEQKNISEVSENFQGLISQSEFMNMQQQIQTDIDGSAEKYDASLFQFHKKDNNVDEESLNLTDSKGVGSRLMRNSNTNKDASPGNSRNRNHQFTLNPNKQQPVQQPKNRFQSIYEKGQKDELEEEIQQDLVSSYFEESRPKQNTIKGHNMQNSQPKSNFREQPQQQDQSQNYQQLIQNPPPKKQHLDKRSTLMNKPATIQVIQKPEALPNEKSLQSQQKISITDSWIQILQLVERGDINEAFTQTFQLDDPIYLLRLLIMTKTPISELTAQNCSLLWSKFLDIYQHNFISILFVQMFSEANELQLVKSSLTVQQMNDLLNSLYEISGTSKGKLSFNAALLYNNIDENLKSKQKN